jgi:hypothetical protein
MSDEIRDLLKGRAGDVRVPADDLSDVLRGGNARRWKNRAYSVGVVVLVAVVGWATIPGLLDRGNTDEDRGEIVATPTPAPACARVEIRATSLPDGWSYEAKAGSASKGSSPTALWHWAPIENGTGAYVEIWQYGYTYTLPDGEADWEPIKVLDEWGKIGAIHDGYTVEFHSGGCQYSMVGFGLGQQELREIGEGLEWQDRCPAMEVGGRVLNLGDGRWFGYIKAIDHRAVEYDVAEFLSGEEANAAAIEAGDIAEGETVPNDYYIVNEDKETGRFPLSENVKVTIDTVHDGIPGPAPADLGWLLCELGGEAPQHRMSHRFNGYWLTVENGLVTEIEEQYVP